MILKILILLCFVCSGVTDQGIELRLFLLNDSTSERYYIDGEYTCGYFSRDLVTNASEHGISIGTVLLGPYQALNGTDNHAMNYCIIDNEVVIIEPQSDKLMSVDETGYEYYLLFPTGMMVESNWTCKYNALKCGSPLIFMMF